MDDDTRVGLFDSMVVIWDRRIRVRYRRGLSEDTAYQTECARAEEMLRRDTWYAGYLYRRLAAASIEAWDARDPDGRPTAITAAALYLLPIGGLQRIVREATGPGIHASVSLTALTTNGASTP